MSDLVPVDVQNSIRYLVSDCKTPKDLIQKTMNMPQVDCPVLHTFLNGNYIRELSVKAGTFLIGHYQKTQHINMFVKGKVAMYNQDGTFKILTAPMYFIGEPGRKIGYVMEDMVWINIYATQETDVDKIENEFLDKSILDDISVEKIKFDHMADHISYREVIERLGFTEEQVQAMVGLDNIIYNHGHYGFKTGPSDIHGTGIFATMDLKAGEFIGTFRIGDRRTPISRFTNHSATPNAKVAFGTATKDMYLIATAPIKGCKGGQNGDEITIDYEYTFKLATEVIP